MNYKQCNISPEGFVIPDFDFDSTDAVIPISAFTPYSFKFDTSDDFVNLLEAIEKNDIKLISKYLCVFRASIIDNAEDLPELLFREYSVPEILMNLINPYKYPTILYESMCAAIAWTGAQNRDTHVFNDEKFIYFLIETAICALSDQKFTGDRKIGNAAIGLLRNLVNNSDEIRVSFVKMDGIKLFSTLFLEITDKQIKNYILWILQNSLNLGSEPPYELLKDIELVLKSSFSFLMRGVEPSEMRIAIAYVKCGPIFALSLMDHVDFSNSYVYFVDANPDTQYMILELYETLLLYPDEHISDVAFEKIKWDDIMKKWSVLMDKRLNKKLISIASQIFTILQTSSEKKYKSFLNTRIIKTLIIIFENSQFSVKLKVMDCLYILIKSDKGIALDSIIYHNCINQIIELLDDENSLTLKFALQMILYIIRFSQDEKIQRVVIEQFDKNEFGPIIEEFCAEEHKPEVAELADLVRNEFEKFSDEFDAICGDDDGNENHFGFGNGNEGGNENHFGFGNGNEGGNENHFGFGNGNEGGAENHFGFGNEGEGGNENHFGFDNDFGNESENENENENKSGDDNDEEEDVWVDVDDDDPILN